MTVSLRKVGTIAFCVGFAVAPAIEILGRCLDALHAKPGMWFSAVALWLWPTSIVLIETSNSWQAYVAFFITAVLNGLLYALVALFVAYCIRLALPTED